MKVQMVSVLAATLLLAARPTAVKADNHELHVLLVIDTNAGLRGGDAGVARRVTEASEKMWRDTINSVYRSGPLFRNRLTLNVLKEHQVSPASIRQFYRRLPYNQGRALLFIYSGHGAIDPRRGPFLATSGGDMARSEVILLMTDRGAPAVFVLTDCCSSIVNMMPGSTVDSSDAGAPKPQTANWRAFYNLFYQTQGLVDMTAAHPGEIAFAPLFTSSLTEMLSLPSQQIRSDGRDGFVSWRDYYGRVYQKTTGMFNKIRNAAPPTDFIRRCLTQRPALAMGRLPVQRPTPGPTPVVGPAVGPAGGPPIGPAIGPPGGSAVRPPVGPAIGPGRSGGGIEITDDP
jgi:hypothetical protein